ncbi:MAG: DUF1761 domain-containing protein [Bacteroidota bacterium]|nr:DUF1761 domain-containing protein [Bacteroidota bacterium]
MDINFLAIFVAALVSFPIGFTWYHPKVFGSAWLKEIDETQESIGKDFNMLKTLLISLICAFFIAMSINFMVVHQYSLFSLLADIPEASKEGAKISVLLNGNEIDVWSNFRTLKHGLFHGFLAGLMFSSPIIIQNALFERKSFKYIAIHSGYWIVTMMLMGGIICVWK